MIVILHNIRSLHNVGSIFRTADAAGIEKIYLCGVTPAPVNRFGKPMSQFTKVSLKAEGYVRWEVRRETGKLINELKKDSYKIFAVEQSKNSIPYFRIKNNELRIKKIALIFGNEVNGLPESILKKADKILEIPMRGRKESLNVSVAFGIVVYRLIYPVRSQKFQLSNRRWN